MPGAGRRPAPPGCFFLHLVIVFVFIGVAGFGGFAGQGVGHGLDGAGERSFGLPVGPAFHHLSHDVGKLGGRLAAGFEVEAVAGFRETEIGIDAGHDDSHVDLEEFDAHQGHTDEDVDDQPAIQNEFQDVVEAARSACLSPRDGAAALRHHGHGASFRRPSRCQVGRSIMPRV